MVFAHSKLLKCNQKLKCCSRELQKVSTGLVILKLSQILLETIISKQLTPCHKTKHNFFFRICCNNKIWMYMFFARVPGNLYDNDFSNKYLILWNYWKKETPNKLMLGVDPFLSLFLMPVGVKAQFYWQENVNPPTQGSITPSPSACKRVGILASQPVSFSVLSSLPHPSPPSMTYNGEKDKEGVKWKRRKRKKRNVSPLSERLHWGGPPPPVLITLPQKNFTYG